MGLVTCFPKPIGKGDGAVYTGTAINIRGWRLSRKENMYKLPCVSAINCLFNFIRASVASAIKAEERRAKVCIEMHNFPSA